MSSHRGPHSGDEPVTGCYGCALKAKSIHLSAAAIPSRQNNVAPRRPDNPWERGVAGEHRADGSFMPFLNDEGSPLGIKPYSENRRRLDEARRRQLTRTTPIGSPEPT